MVLTANKAFGYATMAAGLFSVVAYAGARNYSDGKFANATDPMNVYARTVAGNQIVTEAAGKLATNQKAELEKALLDAKDLVNKVEGELNARSNDDDAMKAARKDLLNAKLQELGLGVKLQE